MEFAWIPLLILSQVALFIGLFSLLMRWFRKKAGADALRLQAEFPSATLVGPGANFFGLESQGPMQLRGNGSLVLTPEALVFDQWVPARRLSIPRRQIIEVSTARSHLGKSVFRPLLKVRFRQQDGAEDAVAWLVGDLESWLAALRQQPVRGS